MTGIPVEEVVRRIPSWRQASSITVAPLPGGITNVTYRVDVDGEAFVVRVWASGADLLGIDRHREVRCMLAASRTGVAPAVVHVLPDEGLLVTRFIPGRSLDPKETATPEVIARVVEAMHRYHAGPPFEGSFSPFRTIEAYLGVARRCGAQLPPDLKTLSGRVAEIESALQPDRTPARPCHNDLWGPNLIDDGQRIRIVDWEYAGMGDIFFDLANFAIYHAASEAGDRALLQAYFGEVTASAFARLKLLKVVAELREAMWYVVALTLPAGSADFVGLAAEHFARCREAAGDPRLPSWLALAGGG
ncbi:MAG: choline/ethanolamine kinase family protein [Armatimonadota bacterium]|nr:choline/ethanolamine kinase family protein [Armatimonadota bacterium]